MTKPTKIKDYDGKEETVNLEDKDYALVKAIQELTNQLKRLNTKY